MSNSINSISDAHQLVVSRRSNEELANDTNTVLGGRSEESTILNKSGLGRFIAHVTHLGSRSAFVSEENNKVVAAFTSALESRHVSKSLSEYSVRQLQARANELSGQKTLLKFSDLQAVLQQQDAKALETIRSYLPASSKDSDSVFLAESDGEAFTVLANKHGIDTPELREQFRTALEARVFGNANNPELGPEGSMHFLAQSAEEAAAGLKKSTFDKPVMDLFNEFPVGLSEVKILQDGPYQISGKPDRHEPQTFIYFKRTSADNIPYDCQGAIDRRSDAKTGAAATSTAAARGEWADTTQKFHFSVDVNALQQGKAWPLLHELLASEENPFMQWKIGNPLGLHASRDGSIEQTKERFMEIGPRLVNAAGEEKRYNPIPILEKQVREMTNLQLGRQGMLADGFLSQSKFDRFQAELDTKQAELNFVKAQYHRAMEDVSDDRCVDGAQFTLYTQHDTDKPWQPEEVQKYTRFLSKLEKVMTDAGVEPGKLPESDVTLPGLRFATFRDEKVSGDASRADRSLNYQHPPAWLLDKYRETPFFQLASQAVESQAQTQAVKV
jgi:hypothetical protein